MLISVNDYEQLTGTILAEEEKARVESLLNVVVSIIEQKLGYTLSKEQITEYLEYDKVIYLNYRPVNEVISVILDGQEIDYRFDINNIKITNFKKRCACCQCEKEVEITYIKGYDELPHWLKFEIVALVNSFESEMSEDVKYQSYKIDDISYTLKDFTNAKNEKINNILRLIYG